MIDEMMETARRMEEARQKLINNGGNLIHYIVTEHLPEGNDIAYQIPLEHEDYKVTVLSQKTLDRMIADAPDWIKFIPFHYGEYLTRHRKAIFATYIGMEKTTSTGYQDATNFNAYSRGRKID